MCVCKYIYIYKRDRERERESLRRTHLVFARDDKGTRTQSHKPELLSWKHWSLNSWLWALACLLPVACAKKVATQ